jgi:hypothetical protein
MLTSLEIIHSNKKFQFYVAKYLDIMKYTCEVWLAQVV